MATTDEIPASSSSSAAASINRDTGSSSSYSTNRESSGASSSSTSASQVCEEEEARGRNQEQQHPHQSTQPEREQQQNGVRFRGILFSFDDASVIRDDTWSCVIVVLTFWFFVAMTVILGVYGPASLSLGPNTSLLIEPNPIFVQSIKVEELEDKNPAPMLYGFYKAPPLDVVDNWSIVYNVSVAADSHKEWIFYLNEGSEISISYSVNPPSSSIFLVIAQGKSFCQSFLYNCFYHLFARMLHCLVG
uniref:E3 ubiquitin-protein ligase APD1-4 N-terminal domain-containing protein n=1 Tax=Rhizophora mucronata TaxID=61149 RepID=A0A2P2LQ52_RHIMU